MNATEIRSLVERMKARGLVTVVEEPRADGRRKPQTYAEPLTCDRCKRKVQRTSISQLRCGECSPVVNRERVRQWMLENRNVGGFGQTECRTCGDTFAKRGWSHKWCSPECKRRKGEKVEKVGESAHLKTK
jgi:hypothetical protein